MCTRLETTIEQFLVSKSSAGLRTRALKWYEYILTSFARWLPADSNPCAPETIEQYLDDLRQRGLSPATVKGHYAGLNVFFGWCVERGALDLSESPTRLLKPPKVPKKRQKATRFEEYEALINSIPRDTWLDLRDRLMVQTLFLSAVRIGGLVNMEIDAYDTITDTIFIAETKGGDDHAIPMLPAVKRAYVEYMFHRPTTTGWLYLSSDGAGGTNGKHITANGVRQRLRTLCTKAGLRYLNPHAFRHGLAVHLLNDKGADMSLIQQILGHKSLSTTATIYARWDSASVARQFHNLMED